jgi:putative FmdB family regulatory protein
MPIREFECTLCNVSVELLQKMDEKPPECPVCGRSMVKLMSATSFVLNGKNWSKDNYGLKAKKKGGQNAKRI